MRQQNHGDDGIPSPVTVVETAPSPAQADAAAATDDQPRAADEAGRANAGKVGGAGKAADLDEASSPDAAPSDDPASSADAAPPAVAAPPRGPAVPIKLLILVTVVNLGLALGLLTLRPPWRLERVVVPTAMPAQVAQLAAQVQRGEHGAPYQLLLTDDDLSATAGYFLAQSADVPFSQVRVTVNGGQVEANAVTTGLAMAVPVRIQANVIAQNGAPVVQVTDVGLGGVPLPSFAQEQVLREANRAVDLSRYNLPVTVDTLELRPGVLEARGTVK